MYRNILVFGLVTLCLMPLKTSLMNTLNREQTKPPSLDFVGPSFLLLLTLTPSNVFIF